MDQLHTFCNTARERINFHFQGYDPSQIVLEVLGTVVVMLVLRYIISNLSGIQNFKDRFQMLWDFG